MKTNKCISKETIQAYIDHELPEKERNLADLHLASCLKCMHSLKENESWSTLVKRSLKEQSYLSVEMPELQETSRKKVPGEKRGLLPAVIKVAAIFLLVIGGTWWLTMDKEKPFQPTEADLIIWESASSGNDANYDWHNPQLPVITEPVESAGKIN